jgi:hypothetical protein
MIAAMVLCAHLAAAHAAKNCREGGTSAIFDTDGGKGLVWQADQAEWDALTKPSGSTPRDRAMSLAGERKLQATLGKPGVTILDSYAAHIIVAINGPVPSQARWWIQSIQFQAENVSAKAAAEVEIREERANRGGVVDLEHLHTQGYIAQGAEERCTANAAEYKKTTGLSIAAVIP